jgi:hypothetical protein
MTQASVRWVAVSSEPALVRQSVPLPAEALGPLLGPLPAARLARLRARPPHHRHRNIRRPRNIRRRDTHRRDTHRRHTIAKMNFRFRVYRSAIYDGLSVVAQDRNDCA